MEEKKKVYIRGCEGHGQEVKDILAGLGATYADEFDYDNDEYIYFINHRNEIICAIVGSEIAFIIMDNYKEIVLPRRQWKNGDILVHERWPYRYAVFKKYKDNDTFEAYLIHLKNLMVCIDTLESVECYHLASAEEIRKVSKSLYAFLNNLEALRKCLSKKESEE